MMNNFFENMFQIICSRFDWPPGGAVFSSPIIMRPGPQRLRSNVRIACTMTFLPSLMVSLCCIAVVSVRSQLTWTQIYVGSNSKSVWSVSRDVGAAINIEIGRSIRIQGRKTKRFRNVRHEFLCTVTQMCVAGRQDYSVINN